MQITPGAKIQLVEAEHGYYDHDVEINIKTFNNLLDLLNSLDEYDRSALRDAGWVNINYLKEAQQTMETLPEFGLVHSAAMHELKDTLDLSRHTINNLVNQEYFVVQKIKSESVLPKEQLETFNQIKKAIKSAENKRKKEAKKREQKKLEREIAKAKKILEKAKETHKV